MVRELKLISWNVNGMRAVMKAGFLDFLAKEQPDILALQEIKMDDVAREKEKFDFSGYDEYWNPAQKKGYAGTAILLAKSSKLKPITYSVGVGNEEFPAQGGSALGGDQEGRVQTLELEDFYLVNVYFPNAQPGLVRLDFKEKFNEAILKYVKKLEKKKPVVMCGDYNVAHKEIDLARPKDNVLSPGFTKEERKWADKFIASGLVDTFREKNSDKVQYSWWSYRTFARDRNIGWRIDYFMVSEKLKDKVKEAFILDEVYGSDHCPVGIIINVK